MKQARFITNPTTEMTQWSFPWTPDRVNNHYGLTLEPQQGMPLFRTDFSLTPGTKKAVLRATALGVFNIYFNGRRVGREELKPGWTDYYCRVFEFEYDVTSLLQPENRLVAVVAPGWWSGRISYGQYGWRPTAFAAEIECFDENGAPIALYASDESWRTAVGGRVRTSDIWNGEYIDATKSSAVEKPDAYPWQAAVLMPEPLPAVVPHVGEPVRERPAFNRRPASAVLWRNTEPNGSDFGRIVPLSRRVGVGCEAGVVRAGEKLILDMGQEMVGRPRLLLRAARGTRIEIYCAEMLNDSGEKARGNDGPAGGLYLANYRTALSRTVYVAGGEGQETCEPLYCFFGFRYFEIRADRDVEILSLTGVCLGTDLKETGYIETDNAEVNRLFENILWGQRSNYLSVPTDCPQRDERLGWTGDTQVFCGAATYNADADGFLRKWLGDARDAQTYVGPGYRDVLPAILPVHPKTIDGSAAWGDAGVIVPYMLYLKYNDVEVVREHYDSMETYMAHLAEFGTHGPEERYGDWLCYEDTPKPYISMCYYAYDASLMQKYARILKKKDREAHYAQLFGEIKKAFHEAYVTEGKLNVTSQTAYLLALRYDLLTAEERPTAVAALADKIKANGYRLSTGFVGTGVLCQTLSDVGLDGLAYSLLLQTADPSWLYSVRQGATTMWERWNSYTLEKGFGDVGMNSFNHYAYGAVAEWMYAAMAGIRPDPANPGFTKFILAPRPDLRAPDEIPAGQSRIGSVRARFDARTGRIESAWAWENGLFTYRFTIPAGTEARIEFPLCNGRESIVLNGIAFAVSELSGRVENGKAVFRLGAGTYSLQ